MADRSRSRSPDRGAASSDQQQYDNNQHHDDDGRGPPADGNAPNSGENGNGEEVKLYVGNLDYGTIL